jgi:hypothetical protein
MAKLQLQKVTRVYNAEPDDRSEASARRSKKAHTKATQQTLLGADLPPSAAGVVVNAAMEAKRHARATEIAKTAMGLRSLAIAAEALRKLPGGGAAADTLLRSLDAAVNKGGKIAVKGRNLVRKKPNLKPDGSVEVGFWGAVLTVAPYAMRAIGPAIAAAKSGLAKFGPALVSNVATAASWVGSKVAPLLDKAKGIPGVAAAATLAKKALAVAGAALGVGTVAASLTESGRAKLKEGARRAYAIARTGVSTVKQGAAASASEAAQALPSLPTPGWWDTAKSVAPWALGAFLAAKVL